MKRTLAAGVAALALSPTIAFAQDGAYVSLLAGWHSPSESTYTGAGFNDTVNYDTGYAVAAAVGYGFNSFVRSEFEIGVIGADASAWTANGPGTGDTSAFTFMYNLIADFENDTVFRPYAGGGVGGARVNSSVASTSAAVSVNDTDTVLAWQGIAGVAIELTEALDFDLSYRYRNTGDADFAVATPSTPLTSDFDGHSFMVGFRLWFGGAEPARRERAQEVMPMPLAAEPAAEATTYTPDPIDFTVYFELDKSNLTQQASNAIRQAAQNALANDIDIVLVEGHTDTSGTSGHNQVLSEGRARVVREALIANGVPANKIRTDALGESRPATQTGDGVREPLNRRTEVTISFNEQDG